MGEHQKQGPPSDLHTLSSWILPRVLIQAGKKETSHSVTSWGHSRSHLPRSRHLEARKHERKKRVVFLLLLM